MRALTFVALAMLAAPWTALAAPAADDVAWLADLLDVEVSDLPTSIPATETRFGPGFVTERTLDLPLAAYAAELRLGGLGTDTEAMFAGAGVRAVPPTMGVRWAGSAVGIASVMGCIDITFQHQVPDPGLGRGAVNVGVHGEIPAGAFGGGTGTATMDVQLLPNAGPGTPIRTTAADGLLVVGTIVESCISVFGLRFTSGSFAGDGVIYADGA